MERLGFHQHHGDVRYHKGSSRCVFFGIFPMGNQSHVESNVENVLVLGEFLKQIQDVPMGYDS